jgi:hypothetical protein
MNKRWRFVSVLMFLLVLAAVPAWAQAGGAEKPRLYTYVSEWTIPRTQWGEMEKSNETSKATLDKLVADGTIIGYGFYYTAAHEPKGGTHGDWIQANSIAGIFKALDAVGGALGRSRGVATNAALLGSGPHEDLFVVSQNYNAHSGTFNDGILRVIGLRVKPGHMDQFREAYTKYLVPVYEQLLANGALHAYQLDSEWNVTSPPGTVYVVSMVAGGEGADRAVAAFNDAFNKNPAILEALTSATDPGARHDYLGRVTVMRRK